MSLRSTRHAVVFGDARRLESVADGAVALVVTSPPYPLVEMWDEMLAGLSAEAGRALARGDGASAFEAAHRELDRVWAECFRVLVPGGLACVNIGDATRTLGGEFRIYPNHARALLGMTAAGFTPLPDILWRKPTNAPNKFMGSGMLPAGAYVTYEHEYILVCRKGGRRSFASAADKARRRESAYFWEERNVWFSDVWEDLPGAPQRLRDAALRARSAAFPFELAYRLINMYSVYGDTVLDPFLGTGTTSAAAIACARSSIGIELIASLAPTVEASLEAAVPAGAERARRRLSDHLGFVRHREQSRRPLKHRNAHLATPVVTAQETDLVLYAPVSLRRTGIGHYEAEHAPVQGR